MGLTQVRLHLCPNTTYPTVSQLYHRSSPVAAALQRIYLRRVSRYMVSRGFHTVSQLSTRIRIHSDRDKPVRNHVRAFAPTVSPTRFHMVPRRIGVWRFLSGFAPPSRATQQPAHLLARHGSLLLEAPVLQLESVGHRRLDVLLTVHVCALRLSMLLASGGLSENLTPEPLARAVARVHAA